MSKYINYNGLYAKFGNRYLSNDIMIINMGTANHCPSRILGMCPHVEYCYAWMNELQYKAVYKYRSEQADFWISKGLETKLDCISHLIREQRNKGKAVRYIRFNESGDFYSQAVLNELYSLARTLYAELNVVSYCYTHRSDLAYASLPLRSIKVIGSDFLINRRGAFVYKNKSEIEVKKLVDMIKKSYSINESRAIDIVYCPGKCKECQVCMTEPQKDYQLILFKKHGNGIGKDAF